MLQTLSGAQVPYDRYRALPLWRFTSLRTLELNAEAMALNEGRAQRFDVRQLAELTQLTNLRQARLQACPPARLPECLPVCRPADNA